MASQFQFIADVRGDRLLITEQRAQFFALYEKQTDRHALVLVHRSPSADQTVLCAARRAAKEKARELGWIF